MEGEELEVGLNYWRAGGGEDPQDPPKIPTCATQRTVSSDQCSRDVGTWYSMDATQSLPPEPGLDIPLGGLSHTPGRVTVGVLPDPGAPACQRLLQL